MLLLDSVRTILYGKNTTRIAMAMALAEWFVFGIVMGLCIGMFVNIPLWLAMLAGVIAGSIVVLALLTLKNTV